MIVFDVPRLKLLCQVKVITCLWSSDDLLQNSKDADVLFDLPETKNQKKSTFQQLPSSFYKSLYVNGLHHVSTNQLWVKAKQKLDKNSIELPLPEMMLEELEIYIEPIGHEIFVWLYQNRDVYKCSQSWPKAILWTSQGTINYEETAKAMMADESLSVSERYRLACFYCLEDLVYLLWWKLSSEEQRAVRYSTKEQGFLLRFWSDVAQSKSQNRNHSWFDTAEFNPKNKNRIRFANKICTLRHNIEESILCHNKTAANYFIKKLYKEDKNKKFLLTVIEKFICKDFKILDFATAYILHYILYFLIINVDEEQLLAFFNKWFRTQSIANQRKLLQIKFHLLHCFLRWPRQSLFMHVLHAYCSEISSYSVVELILNKIKLGYKDCDYLELCRKLLNYSPVLKNNVMIALKEAKLENWSVLLEKEDKITLTCILGGASLEDKGQIFLSNQRVLANVVVKESKWKFLKFFLQLCSVSKEEIIKWKDNCVLELDDVQKNKFFEILDEI